MYLPSLVPISKPVNAVVWYRSKANECERTNNSCYEGANKYKASLQLSYSGLRARSEFAINLREVCV